MKETREEYKQKITKEITGKLDLDINKTYSAEEVKVLLSEKQMNNGVLHFTPDHNCSAQSIIDALVSIDILVADALDSAMGLYENKARCGACKHLFDEGEMLYTISENGENIEICNECRRNRKIKVDYKFFKRDIPADKRNSFVQEEKEHGIDYSDYIERMKQS